MAQFQPATDGLPIAPPPPKGTLDFNSRAPLDPVWPPMTRPNSELGAPHPEKPSDIDLHGGPLIRRDDRVTELTRYQQDGTVTVQGDTVTQQLGRGHTAEYSLSQLAAHSKDPEYFANTMRYAADHGDSVRIDVHNGISRVTDSNLERSLPQNMPLRDPILHAAVKYNVDPVLLAAVGTQETGLGADYLGSGSGYNKVTHRGDVEDDSKDGHGYGPFQLDDRSASKAELERAAKDPYYAADKAASMLADNLRERKGNVTEALQEYNSGNPKALGSSKDWGSVGTLYYADSTMRYYREIQSDAQQHQQQLQTPYGHSR